MCKCLKPILVLINNLSLKWLVVLNALNLKSKTGILTKERSKSLLILNLRNLYNSVSSLNLLLSLAHKQKLIKSLYTLDTSLGTLKLSLHQVQIKIPRNHLSALLLKLIIAITQINLLSTLLLLKKALQSSKCMLLLFKAKASKFTLLKSTIFLLIIITMKIPLKKEFHLLLSQLPLSLPQSLNSKLQCLRPLNSLSLRTDLILSNPIP